jgi:NAD+ kinase
MKIILFSRPEVELAPEELDAIFASLRDNRLDYMVNAAFAVKINATTNLNIPSEKWYGEVNHSWADDSIMVSYGGDGTFLDAVRLLRGAPVPILGFNFGHLGFLANAPKEGIGNAFGELREKRYTLQERSLLRVKGDFAKRPEHPYAMNEFALQRDGIGMISVEASVDGERVATYRGDGVIVSTPTGSTAYSLSAGGPVVAPDCRCFIISPIAPHNLSMRPIVIPDTSEVRLRVAESTYKTFASIDNTGMSVGCGAEFRITKAEKSIFLVKLQNISFYDTLRNKMMWGMDGRDNYELRITNYEL